MSENGSTPARVFEESLEAVEAARVVRERTAQIRYEMESEKCRDPAEPVDPDAEATLRRMLCAPCS